MGTKYPRIGVRQGCLSPDSDHPTQSFPWHSWESEFAVGDSIGLSLLQWTLDRDRIFENPLMTEPGREMIRVLAKDNKISVPSLMGSCFAQSPYWKAKGQEQIELVATFAKVLDACAQTGINSVVVPLLDNATLASPQEQDVLEKILIDFTPLLSKLGLTIVFESDFPPEQLAKFISGFPQDRFGINFNMGNSAGFGWNPDDEIKLLAPRIGNVTVRDCLRGGKSVPLGEGAVNFPKVFSLLKTVGYRGNYILQPEVGLEDKRRDTLRRYTGFLVELMSL